MQCAEQFSVREALPRKKGAYFWTFSKRGAGWGQVQPEFKCFGIVFMGAFFGHLKTEDGGLHLFQKLLVCFEVVLR